MLRDPLKHPRRAPDLPQGGSHARFWRPSPDGAPGVATDYDALSTKGRNQLTMDPERDRLKHLLIILLEALSGPQEVTLPIRARIQEKAEAAGLDEGDVHGLLD